MTVAQVPFSLNDAQLSHYAQHGYVIVRGLFLPEEVEPLRQACEADPEVYDTQSEIRYSDGVGYKLSVWGELGNSMLGVMPRMARLVDSSETLLGQEECYHWHSKIVLKKPGEGLVSWHQDFGTWYEDHCLYPKLVSCCVAINEHSRENGCLKIVRGSHHLGRIGNVILPESNSNEMDPERLKVILDRLEIVHCELKQGDAIFFHANTLHGSDINRTSNLRIAMFSTYNVASNEPYDLTNQMHHRYVSLEKLPDTVLLEHQYDGIFETQTFFEVETEDDPKNGVSIRSGRTPQVTKNLGLKPRPSRTAFHR